MKNRLLSIFAILISIAAFITVLHDHNYLKIDLNSMFSVIGIIITATAFTIGGYFAILAVSAYSYVRDIESIKTRISSCINDVEKLKTDMGDQYNSAKNRIVEVDERINITNDEQIRISKAMVATLDSYLSHQIFVDDIMYPSQLQPMKVSLSKYLTRRRNEIMRTRSRLALEFSFMEKGRRMDLIRELVAVGEKTDILALERIIKRDEDSDIKMIAKMVLENINRKPSGKDKIR